MPRLQPVIAPVIVILQRFYKPRKHTGLFEKDDMTDLFERQRYQRDNRIAEADIERLQKLLRVSELTVGSIMIPRKRVVAVNEKESINPVLVNELHQTGHSYFPVYEGESQNIIGTLAIQAIADIHQHGVIRDNIDRHVAFLYHNDNIEQALHAFYTTNQHLFIVLNDSGKYIGILTINDALRQFVGTLKHHVFDAYEDREKVVARHTTTKTVSQKSTEVVE
jgi:magnesium and cobalt transporter